MKHEKKQYINEGRAVGGGPFQYGGFPKVIKEETQEEGNWEQFIGLVNNAKKAYFDTLPGESGKKMMPSDVHDMLQLFIRDPSEKGDNVTDDLIQAGFPAEHIANAAKIRKASIEQMRNAQAKINPQSAGYGAPGEAPRFTGD